MGCCEAPMIRELGTLCLAPVVLMGYMATSGVIAKVDPNTQTTTGSGTMLEVMTCEKGWGLDAKASTNGLYGVDLQYGFQYKPNDFSVTFLPKLGLSYVDHPVSELPQRTQFGLGGHVLFGYKDFRVGLELWHLSNGKAMGLAISEDARSQSNVGLNLLSVQMGWVF
jgi:hypothetical protein